MIIENEGYKQKIINEINDIIKNNNVKWKSLNEDNNDFMTNINYSYKPNPKRNETKTISFGYRVCCFGNTPKIFVYDYAYKKGPTETTELPCIEVSDETIKDSGIYKLLETIKFILERDRKEKEDLLLDKLSWYLNSKNHKGR